MRWRPFYILCFWLAVSSYAAGQIQSGRYDPFRKQASFTANGRDTVYVLPEKFLIPGSVEVTLDSLVLQEHVDYGVDFRSGEIRLIQPPDSGQSILVAYTHLPVRLQLQYRHWTVSEPILQEEQTENRVTLMKPEEESRFIEYGGDLQKSGSVFRGITLGTDQGMRLQSGLRLQISGNIAPNVEVVASLTDQNTPIQPEGNTQTLQEIDKVFVNIQAPGFRSTLGDYMYQVNGMAFGSYSKKLQGAMAAIESSFGELTLSAAASRGQLTTNVFMGQESNQGPYQLKGGQGQREIIVLAGTEHVWVDGELMIRGEDNDYTIEYGNGQIIFTRNRLITEDSRITVDFEYSNQKFQKEMYGASGNIRFFNDRITFKGTFLREVDDKDHPLESVLTDETKRILEKAGDDPDSAFVSGIKFVGANQGSYKQIDSSGFIIYRYVGMDQGEYTVQFSYVGAGQGDYSFQGYGIYRYEGGGQGSYLPVVYMPLATSHEMVDLATSIHFGRGISFEGEIGLSDRDLNTYSSVDDKDNIGMAFQGVFRLDQRNLRFFGKEAGRFGMEGSIRIVDNRFRSVGRMTEVEYDRKWGVGETVLQGENVQEIKGFYSPIASWTVEGEVGFFERGEDFRSDRKVVKTALLQPQIPKIQYQVEVIETEKKDGYQGYWLRQRGSLEGRRWGLTPSIQYEGEDRKEDFAGLGRTGFRFDAFTGGLVLTRGAFRGEIQETIRDDRKYAGPVIEKYSLAKTDFLRLEYSSGNVLSSSFIITHRDRDYTDVTIQDQKSDLADMKIGFSPWRRLVNGLLNYQFSSTRISQTVMDTVKVGAGLGDYRYDEDLQELVPDPDGDMIYRTIQTGLFLPVNHLKTGFELRLDASRLWNKPAGFQQFFSSWNSRLLMRIERRDKEKNFIKVNRAAFYPQWGTDTTLVLGLFSFYQDFEYISPYSGFSLRFRFRKDDSENHQLLYEGLIRHAREQSVLVKGNPAKRLGMLFEYQRQTEWKDYATKAWSNRDIRSDAWTVETSYKPRQEIEIALKARLRTARDRYPDPIIESSSFFLFPRFGYSFQGRGHLRAELEWGEVRSKPQDRILPYELLGGDQPGRTLRWTVLLTYQMTGHVMATLNYRGRHEPWREKLYQSGQIEVRAFF